MSNIKNKAPALPLREALPKKRARKPTMPSPIEDERAETKKTLLRLTPTALEVLERQLSSADERIAHNAATKILGLLESMEAWRAQDSVTVIFQGVPEPGLPTAKDVPATEA